MVSAQLGGLEKPKEISGNWKFLFNMEIRQRVGLVYFQSYPRLENRNIIKLQELL